MALEIVFRHMDPSEALDALVREKYAKLQGVCDRITHCRVVLDATTDHTGDRSEVHIDIDVPGKHIRVSQDDQNIDDHSDMYAAVRDAFQVALRQVKQYTEKRHEHRPNA